MGQHTEVFRELIKGFPKTSKGLTPELARKIILHVTNQALQIIIELEETIEDRDKTIDVLTESLLGADAAPGNSKDFIWTPKDGSNG